MPGARAADLNVKVEDPKNMQGANVGDPVELTYTQALAMSLDKPAKSGKAAK